MKNVQFMVLFLGLLLLPMQVVAGEEPEKNIDCNQVDRLVLSQDQLSAEEQQWFATFQEGTFYIQGWKAITADILEKTPEEVRERQRTALEALGVKIGCEWSKDNEVRKIDNDMLSQWGSLLKEAAGHDPEQIPEVIVEIQHKVDMLLN